MDGQSWDSQESDIHDIHFTTKVESIHPWIQVDAYSKFVEIPSRPSCDIMFRRMEQMEGHSYLDLWHFTTKNELVHPKLQVDVQKRFPQGVPEISRSWEWDVK